MHPDPMKTENWKPVPVILNVSLLTVLFITGWTLIDRGLALIFSGNLWDHVGSRRWHGLESIDKSIALSKRNGDEQMVQIPAVVEKLHVVHFAPILQALLLLVSVVACIMYQVNSEKYCLFSAIKYEEFIKIIFLLFLISRIPVTTACDQGEYDNDGVCCSLCSPGSRVSKHCTLKTGTKCNPCTTGGYMEHPNDLEKCFKCKMCDPELGLQVKQNCTYTNNTICEPRDGFYCIENCQKTRKHTECPPGEGVIEKGTSFKDTVCEKCPDGTFSSEASTTEECKDWTVCETLNLKQVEPGNAEADVKCEAEHNWRVPVVHVVVPIVLVAISLGIVAFVLWKKHKHKTGNQNFQGARNHNDDEKVTEPLRDVENAVSNGRNHQK